MILVVGQLPNPENARDGMVQRIAAVDALLEGEERIYLTPRHETLHTSRFELEFVGPALLWGRPNLFERLDVERMVSLARQARAVYVHSVHWAQHVLPLYTLGNVVTDLHGIVPEEQRMVGQVEEAAQLDRVERFALMNGFATVAVSEAMASHLQTKYPDLRPRVIVLPNLSRLDAAHLGTKSMGWPLRFIYAGGTHPWQNIPRMLNAVRRLPWDIEMSMLTPDVERLSRMVREAGLSGRVRVRSVDPAFMPEEYARAHFGFVLRDDHIVNRVSCPTKLQEYLAHGVLPIVLERGLGDFESLGYVTLALEQLESGNLPGEAAWREAVLRNRQVFERLGERVQAGESELKALMAGAEAPGKARQGAEEVALLPLSRALDQFQPVRAANAHSHLIDVALRLARKLGV